MHDQVLAAQVVQQLLASANVHGAILKAGPDVLVSVRRALGGKNLGQLREAVTKEFLTLDEHEQSVRTVMAKLETGFLRRFATFQHE